MIVSVVAGGWSFKGDGWLQHAERLPGLVIGVNDAGLILKGASEIVGMDRLWTEARWTAMSKLGRPAFIRVAALKKIPDHDVHTACGWLHPFACDHESVAMSDDPAVINGTNSGTCGVGRAWQHKPVEVYLFGFDMQPGPKGEAHWYPQYHWQNKVKGPKRDWAVEFANIAGQFRARGIKVYNASSRSLITAFPRVSPKDLKL